MAHRHKLSIAREQIEEGIRHLVSGQLIAALTLLAAAEELLARFYEEDNGVHPLEIDWRTWEAIRLKFKVPSMSKREHYRITYAARNSAKHHDAGDPRLFKHDCFISAHATAQRAIHYARMNGLKFRYESLYNRWFRINFSPENNGKGLHFFPRNSVR